MGKALRARQLVIKLSFNFNKEFVMTRKKVFSLIVSLLVFAAAIANVP